MEDNFDDEVMNIKSVKATKDCPVCKTKFEYMEDDMGFFSSEPDTCGEASCEKEYERLEKIKSEQRAQASKLEREKKVLSQAISESNQSIAWADPDSSSSLPFVEWTPKDKRCALAIGKGAINICNAKSLDGLIFLGESLAPIKHYVIDQMKSKSSAPSVRKVSGSFSGISVASVSGSELEEWLGYVKNKLPQGNVKVGFIDYSATGKTFMSLAQALSKANWLTCSFVFIPIVKQITTLPETIRKQIERDCPSLKVEIFPFHVPMGLDEYTCNDLLTNEKMKKILGRRSRRLQLTVWNDELRKKGMSEGMPSGWRKAVSLRMLDESTNETLRFPVQPTFEDTETAARRRENT